MLVAPVKATMTVLHLPLLVTLLSADVCSVPKTATVPPQVSVTPQTRSVNLVVGVMSTPVVVIDGYATVPLMVSPKRPNTAPVLLVNNALMAPVAPLPPLLLLPSPPAHGNGSLAAHEYVVVDLPPVDPQVVLALVR